MFVDWSSCTQGAEQVATLSCLPQLLQVVVYWAIAFAGIVALFLIIYSGYKFMTSGGDAKSTDSARKTLTWAILGLVLIFLSFLIIDVIATFTGVSCIKNFGFGQCVKTVSNTVACVQNNHACTQNSDCCSSNCVDRPGAPGIKMCN